MPRTGVFADTLNVSFLLLRCLRSYDLGLTYDDYETKKPES